MPSLPPPLKLPSRYETLKTQAEQENEHVEIGTDSLVGSSTNYYDSPDPPRTPRVSEAP